MQPSARQKELEALYEKRRKGHVPQLSITDANHHITEAIGSYYDDEPSAANTNFNPTMMKGRDSRPLSFVSSPDETYQSKEAKRAKRNGSYFDHKTARIPLGRTASNEKVPTSPAEGAATSPSLKSLSSLGAENENGSGTSPGNPSGLSRQSSTDTAISQFPLNDIDYESSPAAVAQELSNLQAIRRMSMNVDTADPDLPTFGVPAVSPSAEGDDDDAARLFWVPARLHPELAPKEFKTFIEERVDKIKRRSGDSDALKPEGPDRAGSDSSLRRKKSMLSRQVHSNENYQDGAEKLERKRSKGMTLEGQAPVELEELEQLANDPAELIRRMSLDTARRSSDSGVEVPPGGDMPVLPPAGASLKRSTRTAYRRGSLKKGERVPFSRRAQARNYDSETDDASSASPITPASDEPMAGLSRVQTEPIPPPSSSTSSQPSRAESKMRWKEAPISPPPSEPRTSDVSEESRLDQSSPRPSQDEAQPPPRPVHRQFQSRLASGHGRTTAQLPGYDNQNPLPQIIETLPDGTKKPAPNLIQSIPDRKPSHEAQRGTQRGGAHMRPAITREQQQRQPQRSSTLDDISSRPSPLPGSGNTSTDALTMVPTFNDTKTEKKDGGRKSSWKWILGNDEDKVAKEEKKEEAASGKAGKASKLSKPAAERARLDLLQTSIDGNQSRGRESLVLNRDDLRLEEERKKESKKSSEGKKDKEKDSGLLSAIFSGVKKKTTSSNNNSNSDEPSNRKGRKSDRNASPEPPPRLLKPDIDYNWTRFSILEERAIYRMAHIKLANPRRALYSQVLLSNFMYSYLAKVQMMHPQVQIPAAHQPKGQQQQRKQEEQKSEEFSQYQRWQQQQEREAAEAAAATAAASKSNSPSSSSAGNRTSLEIISPGGPVQQSHYQYPQRPATTEYHEYDYDDNQSSASEDYNDYDNQNRAYQLPPQQSDSFPQPNRPNGVGTRGAGSGGAGSGYSVAQTHDYLGYPKDQTPFDSRGMSLWESSEDEEDDGGKGDLWR